MSEHSLDNFDRRVLKLVIDNPRSHAYDLHKKMLAAWVGDSLWRGWLWILLGPSPSRMYVSLAKLERFDLVKSEWAIPDRSGFRHRLYRPAHISGEATK